MTKTKTNRPRPAIVLLAYNRMHKRRADLARLSKLWFSMSLHAISDNKAAQILTLMKH